MANIQTKNGFWHKFFGWFRRHKATASFCVVIIALALYLGGSWAVLQVQIHFEREQFSQARMGLNDLYNHIVETWGQPSLTLTEQTCRYTSVEIGQGTRSCDVNKFMSYNDVPTSQAAIIQATNIENTIKHSYRLDGYRQLSLDDLGSTAGSMLVRSDSFKFSGNKINCGGDYYWAADSSKLSEDFPISFQTASGLVIQLNCSANAKAEYFPVVRD